MTPNTNLLPSARWGLLLASSGQHTVQELRPSISLLAGLARPQDGWGKWWQFSLFDHICCTVLLWTSLSEEDAEISLLNGATRWR